MLCGCSLGVVGGEDVDASWMLALFVAIGGRGYFCGNCVRQRARGTRIGRCTLTAVEVLHAVACVSSYAYVALC